MFSSEVRRNGEATREANHGLKTALGTVLGFFGLASLCTLTRVTHVCHDTPPQHHENHGVSLKRDMKVKTKQNKTKHVVC